MCRARDEGAPQSNAWHGPAAALWLIDANDREQALDAELPLLGPHDAMVWSLEGVIRLLLFRLVGVGEVDLMLDRWIREGANGERADEVTSVLASIREEVRFAALVRRLVREQVPVTDTGALLRTFAECARHDVPGAPVEAARKALVHSLPGIADERSLVEVGSGIEAAIAQSATVPGPLPIAEARSLLGEAGEALLSGTPARTALVVADPATRPGVQHAAETLTRSAAVLSVSELRAAGVLPLKAAPA